MLQIFYTHKPSFLLSSKLALPLDQAIIIVDVGV